MGSVGALATQGLHALRMCSSVVAIGMRMGG